MLPVAAQADALFQVVHREQMIFPLPVDHAQHDHALVIAHGLGADQLLFRVVALFELLENRVAEFLAIHLLRLQSLGIDVDPEARKNRILQPFEVPVVGVRFRQDNAVRECRRESPET